MVIVSYYSSGNKDISELEDILSDIEEVVLRHNEDTK